MNSDFWYILFLFFSMIDNSSIFMDLLKSKNFEKDYNEIINKVEQTDANILKNKIIEVIKINKNKVLEMNKNFKEIEKGTKL